MCGVFRQSSNTRRQVLQEGDEGDVGMDSVTTAYTERPVP